MTVDVAVPDPRARAAWRAWLSALAVDAEAAIAAALTYESLDGASRDAFLDAVDEDAASVDAPRVALYAPLLAVEGNSIRRQRLSDAITAERIAPGERRARRRAFWGVSNGTELTVLLLPLYLGFVEVLACRWSHEVGYVSAEHEPLRASREFQRTQSWNGVALEERSFDEAIEELAHAVVTSTRRTGRAPDALVPFADLFSLRASRA